MDASAGWEGHYAQILRRTRNGPMPSRPSLFVHVKRDVRLLVRGDSFMVEMATHEKK